MGSTLQIKVLCFGRFYDEVPGGMQRHVEHLFAALEGKVKFVHLVPSRDFSSARLELSGVPVVRTRSLNLDGSLAISPGLILEAIRLNRTHQFDLIHLHFPDPMCHLASLFLPKSIPRVITWHSDVIRQQSLLRLYQPFQRRALRQAAAVITATPAHIEFSQELSMIPDPNRMHVIPYGFDFNRFTHAHPDAQAIRDAHAGKLIFALGRHVYYKGFDVLIRAMDQLSQDTQLIIGGTGPLTAEWQQLAKHLGLEDRIHFTGLIDGNALPAYYQACDLFCLPATSQAEAFGIVQVEAMACGKPVVSTRLNNGVDYVNQHGVTGLTVEPNDIDALANALLELLGDAELRNRLGIAAKRRALGDFSLEAMGEKTLSLFRQVIGR